MRIGSTADLDYYFSLYQSYLLAENAYDEEFFANKFLHLYHFRLPHTAVEVGFRAIRINPGIIEVDIYIADYGRGMDMTVPVVAVLEIDRALSNRNVSATFTNLSIIPCPPVPTVLGTPTTTSIILNTIEGAEYRMYSYDNKPWQSSPTFTGLTPDTNYRFEARFRTDLTISPPSSPGAVIRTAATAGKGDVDGDGVIDAADITLLRRYIAAEDKKAFLDANPRFNIDNADVNGDGVIDANDVALLRRYVAGFNVTLGGETE
jgi:hypothetical protein